MINTSTEYKKMSEKERNFTVKATCILKDGTQLELNKSNFFSGGVIISDGVSGSSQFDIGAAIINQLTLVIDNANDVFSDYDFTNAVITVWVGMQLSDRIEWLKKGVFNSADPTTTPAVLTLKALDNMSKFDVIYDGNLKFPCNLQSIVQYCCGKCNVLLNNGQFPNYTYTILKNPFDRNSGNVTYRALIAYCALLAGCYARCNADGWLEFKWYDTAVFEGFVDGGIFDQVTKVIYQTGDNLDGGNFKNYNDGDTANGGMFTENLSYHHIYNLSSLSVSTEDVVITGIRVKAADSEDSVGNKVEGETYLCGAEGYILQVSGNPLIEAGKAKNVAEYLAGRIVGMRFRPFNASCIGDPTMEAGDAAVITDRKGNSYSTYLTNITYSVGDYASICCDAEPSARHSADRYSQIDQIVADIKKDSQRQLSYYAKYADQMNQLAVNALGYYETNEKQNDGSTVSYMHDKPLLSQSRIVYKQSIDGFFWSQDGGKTWAGGIDKNGNAVMNVIAAIGISFDWAHGGTLTLGGKDNVNGRFEILNADGTENGHWDKDGIDILKGNINLGEGAFIADDNGNVKSEGTDSAGTKRIIDSSKGTLDFFKGNDRIGRITPFPLVVYDDNANFLSISGRDGINFSREYESGGKIYGTSPCMSIRFESNGIAKIIFYQNAYFNSPAYMRGIRWQDNVSCGIDSNGAYGTKVLGGLHSTGNITCDGYMSCHGAKPRIVGTENYSERFLYCYEMPSPMFGDIGEGMTDENGVCYVSIDDVFLEAVNSGMEYQVFLQKEGEGDIWVAAKTPTYFVVKGTQNLKFAWEIKAKQRGYEYDRMESLELSDTQQIDYETEYIEEIKTLMIGREMSLYEAVE